MRGTFRCGLGGWHPWCSPGLEMSSPARKKWKWSKSGEKWKWTLNESGKESGSRLWVSLQIATLLLHVPACFFSPLISWSCWLELPCTMASGATNSHCSAVIRLSRVTPAPCACFKVHRTRQESRGEGVGAERSTEPQEVLPGGGGGRLSQDSWRHPLHSLESLVFGQQLLSHKVKPVHFKSLTSL